ncbi:hypothetical protein N658DRAFT_145731 [Parathielavia hyrcaniae]|uniref:Uncharacterized protein n=1 Tax=Parathielavia hyrcaniae TaxID=113614 RepID=A0AAN6PYD3_9PEZI|nr:hypothetical protein N658DRAFT_145731 [Parathielavia hyrcaniae]
MSPTTSDRPRIAARTAGIPHTPTTVEQSAAPARYADSSSSQFIKLSMPHDACWSETARGGKSVVWLAHSIIFFPFLSLYPRGPVRSPSLPGQLARYFTLHLRGLDQNGLPLFTLLPIFRTHVLSWREPRGHQVPTGCSHSADEVRLGATGWQVERASLEARDYGGPWKMSWVKGPDAVSCRDIDRHCLKCDHRWWVKGPRIDYT